MMDYRSTTILIINCHFVCSFIRNDWEKVLSRCGGGDDDDDIQPSLLMVVDEEFKPYHQQSINQKQQLFAFVFHSSSGCYCCDCCRFSLD